VIDLKQDLRIGKYRPIYLWGGSGTVRMNRLKFMDVDVDEKVHMDAHTEPGAKVVLDKIHNNWVHLMYNWGFPPEIETGDWEEFRHAAEVYHRLGTKVFAYLQTSNCVFRGSFEDKEWYARDPAGKKITYFTYSGRYMACLNHPEWRRHLEELITGALERGADGIFFDNIFQGRQPVPMLGRWFGSAGCFCDRCKELFRTDTRQEIPTIIDTELPLVREYLRWRAKSVSSLMADMGDYIRSNNPGSLLSANDFDPVMHDSFLLYGIDLSALARIQDITMIENFGLPGWEPGGRPRFPNNALNIRIARELIGDSAHLSMLSYDVGIGFDQVYPARRYLQGIAETAACRTSMTTKGTEYFDGKRMTLLTSPDYAEQQAEIGRYNRWLEANAAIYNSKTENRAPVGLLFPGEALWFDWHRLAPAFFGLGQSLNYLGIPWRVVSVGADFSGLQALVTYQEEAILPGDIDPEISLIEVHKLENWKSSKRRSREGNQVLDKVLEAGLRAGIRAYSDVKFARLLMDRIGLQKLFTQSPYYFLPSEEAIIELAESLPGTLTPRISSKEPVLIEYWTLDSGYQLHLVNYAGIEQEVEITLPGNSQYRIVSPDDLKLEESGSGIEIRTDLDIYKVVHAELIG
jgi:hypothetical protein